MINRVSAHATNFSVTAPSLGLDYITSLIFSRLLKNKILSISQNHAKGKGRHELFVGLMSGVNTQALDN